MRGSDLIEALVLGIIQGIAEFLPISSSGHIVIFGEILRQVTGRDIDPRSNLQMNVALHMGTLFSILFVYWRDLIALRRQRDVCLAIVLATLPIVIVGWTLKDWMQANLFTPTAAGFGLLVTATILTAAGRFERRDRPKIELPQRAAVGIGLFQAIALLPGVSRSGSTIAGGLLMRLPRERATSFSFFIAIPALCGAVVLTARDLVQGEGGAHSVTALLAGATVSFVVGVIALKGLIRIVARGQLYWFAMYCALVGGLTLIWQFIDARSM